MWRVTVEAEGLEGEVVQAWIDGFGTILFDERGAECVIDLFLDACGGAGGLLDVHREEGDWVFVGMGRRTACPPVFPHGAVPSTQSGAEGGPAYFALPGVWHLAPANLWT